MVRNQESVPLVQYLLAKRLDERLNPTEATSEKLRAKDTWHHEGDSESAPEHMWTGAAKLVAELSLRFQDLDWIRAVHSSQPVTN
jgi:sugar (pentulose or hexulose) kinase